MAARDEKNRKVEIRTKSAEDLDEKNFGYSLLSKRQLGKEGERKLASEGERSRILFVKIRAKSVGQFALGHCTAIHSNVSM